VAAPPPPSPTFRTSGAARALTVVMAVLFTALALASCWLVPQGGTTLAAAAVAVGIAVALALLIVRPAFVARLDFQPESLRCTPGWGVPWEMAYADVRGFRLIDRQGGPRFSIVPGVAGRPALMLPPNLGRPAELRAALAARLPDLDAADLADDLARVKADPELGPDEPSRLDAIARAKAQLRIALGITVVAAVGSFIPPTLTVAGWVLAAIPVAALCLVGLSRGALTIGGPPKGARPDAGILFLIPGILLVVLDLRQWHVLEYSNLGVPWAAAALLVLGASALAVRTVQKTSAVTYIFLAVFTVSYSFGLVLLVNCGLDRSAPQVAPTRVVSRRISHGKSTSYYVRVSPWLEGSETREVAVSRKFYYQHPDRTPVTVVLRPGTLAIPWFELQ